MFGKDLLDQTIQQKIHIGQEKLQQNTVYKKKKLFGDSQISLPAKQDIRRSTWGKKQAQALDFILNQCNKTNQLHKHRAQPLKENQKNDLNIKNEQNQTNIEGGTKKQKQNEAVFHRPTIHLRSMIANLGWIFAFVIFIPEKLAGIIDIDGWALFLILMAFYIFYMCLGLIKNTLLDYLKDQNISHGEDIELQYNSIRQKAGNFTFFAECYHFQTKTKTIVVPTQNGTVTKTITYVQKVVTHTARQNVYPAKTVDDSGRIKPISFFKKILFIHNIVNYRFKDDKSRQLYNKLWEQFKIKNKKDTHQLYVDDYIIPGLKQRLTFYVEQKPTNYKALLLIWTILGLLWPFSIFVQAKAERYQIDYMKVVTM